MDNRNYQYLDHDFDPAKAGNYTLLVQVGGSSFSFAVTDGSKVLVLAEGLDVSQLGESSGEDDLLFKNYRQTIIGLPDTGFTFVPVSLFNPGKVADFARFLDVKPTEKVFSQPLDAENQVIFKINGDLVNIITERFDVKDIVFAANGWIKAVATEGPPNQYLYLNIGGDKVDILNSRDGKLRFYNSFGFQNEDELAYFTSMVAGELQLPAEAITLVLSGDISTDDQNGSRLAKFFNRVELNSVTPVKLPKQFPSHSLLYLTALSLCGSSAEY